jgi:hypothetical protein
LADEFFQRFGGGGIFLDVDAGFLAQDEAEQRLEDDAVALRVAGFVAGTVLMKRPLGTSGWTLCEKRSAKTLSA